MLMCVYRYQFTAMTSGFIGSIITGKLESFILSQTILLQVLIENITKHYTVGHNYSILNILNTNAACPIKNMAQTLYHYT